MTYEEKERKAELLKNIEFMQIDLNKVWLDIADMKTSLFLLSQDVKKLKEAIEERQ